MAGASGSWTRPDKINLIIAVAAVVTALGSLLPIANDYIDNRNAPSARFLEPDNNERISGSATEASGTVKNIDRFDPVWLILRTSVDCHWYASQRLTIQDGDNEWKTKRDEPLILAGLGEYEVYLYLATDAANSSLEAYLKKAPGVQKRTGKWPWLNSLPEGMKRLDVKPIIRYK
jgi:hypothetical protein